MIIEDQEDDDPEAALLFDHEERPERLPPNGPNFRQLFIARQAFRNSDAHYDLRNNLVEHIWAFFNHEDDEV